MKEALKLALEALEFIPESGSMLGAHAEEKRINAIAAIKRTLAAPLVVDMFSHTKSNPPCKHFLTGIFNDTAKKCPYCEIDSLRNTMQALSEANEAWSTKLKDASVAAIAEAAEVDRLTAELATLKGASL